MRIGEPALRHGVSEPDIRHAVRNVMRRVVMDEDLTMLIGPSFAGGLLEVGVLGIGGEDPVVIHAMALRQRFHRLL